MSQGKISVLVLVTLIIGFAGGFVLRPVIAPPQHVDAIAVAPSSAQMSSEARSTQYFVAHIDEAWQVLAGCRDDSVRGGECSNADEAIIKVDAQERRSRFLSN